MSSVPHLSVNKMSIVREGSLMKYDYRNTCSLHIDVHVCALYMHESCMLRAVILKNMVCEMILMYMIDSIFQSKFGIDN